MSCTVGTSVRKSATSAGSDGRYMSVDIGPNATSVVSRAATATESGRGRFMEVGRTVRGHPAYAGIAAGARIVAARRREAPAYP